MRYIQSTLISACGPSGMLSSKFPKAPLLDSLTALLNDLNDPNHRSASPHAFLHHPSPPSAAAMNWNTNGTWCSGELLHPPLTHPPSCTKIESAPPRRKLLEVYVLRSALHIIRCVRLIRLFGSFAHQPWCDIERGWLSYHM